MQADFRSGNTRVAFSGVVNEPMKMGGVDLRLNCSGAIHWAIYMI